MADLIGRRLRLLGRRLRGGMSLPRWDMVRSIVVAALLATVAGYALSQEVGADSAQARGQYLVRFGGCTDCHTPGHLLGKPDLSHYLGGSDVGLEVPGLGIFVAPNLTPDDETGLGKWTKDDITRAIQTGVRPDGRMLAPIMPWRAYAGLTQSDVAAVVEYLKNLPPIKYKVPGPFGVDEKPTIFRMKILPPDDAGQQN